MRNISSLNTTISNDEGNLGNVTQLLDLIHSDIPTPYEYLDDILRLEYLNALLNTLNQSDHQLIEMRYGLNGNIVHTLKQLGVKFNLTTEAVRGRVLKTLALLKRNSLTF